MECIENNAENIGKAVEILKAGGIVAHPADTCFGLAADLMNEDAIDKLKLIKGRDAVKPMSIMLPAFIQPKLNEYSQLNDFAEMICDKLFPGPVTIVLPKGPKIPESFFPQIPTIGIRIPYDAKMNDLVMKFGSPLITTSANLSDQPVCCSCEDVVNIFESSEHQPDLMLEGDIQGSCMPSTVISLENDKVTILREGPLEKEQIEAILGINI